MQQPLPGADVRLDLVLGVAEHLLPSRRIHDRAGFEIPVPDAFLGSGEGQREPLLAFAQRRFGAFALGDLANREDDGRGRGGRRGGAGIVEPCDGDFDVGDRAVRADDLLFERSDDPAGGDLREAFLPGGVAIGVKDAGQRLAHELVGPGPAAQLPGRRVDECQDAVLTDEDAVRRPFHDTSIGFAGHVALPRSSKAVSLRIDHAADVVTGKILPAYNASSGLYPVKQYYQVACDRSRFRRIPSTSCCGPCLTLPRTASPGSSSTFWCSSSGTSPFRC